MRTGHSTLAVFGAEVNKCLTALDGRLVTEVGGPITARVGRYDRHADACSATNASMLRAGRPVMRGTSSLTSPKTPARVRS
jgi:hypothetical protein